VEAKGGDEGRVIEGNGARRLDDPMPGYADAIGAGAEKELAALRIGARPGQA
jgi:hypothetical protein